MQHAALSLSAPPTQTTDDRLHPVQHLSTSPENHVAAGHAANHTPDDPVRLPGPVSRKDTSSSTATNAPTIASTLTSTDSTNTQYSVETASPTFAAPGQAVFSAKDGSNVNAQQQRRPSRRRTGPLTAIQRQRAHLIRKMGACSDCRRRRVAVSMPFVW